MLLLETTSNNSNGTVNLRLLVKDYTELNIISVCPQLIGNAKNDENFTANIGIFNVSFTIVSLGLKRLLFSSHTAYLTC